MREIEIKCRVTDGLSLQSKLESIGIKLGPAKSQHDVVYGWPGAKEAAFKNNWLRIRTEDEKTVYFTLKRSVVGHLDSIEHEVIVDNADELREIILNLGYELYSDLTKIRRKAAYGDIEICFDEVPGLGTFIEAEKIMHKDAEHDEVVAELWGLFDSLGITKDQEVHEGYDILERKMRGVA